jgi:ribonuclease E
MLWKIWETIKTAETNSKQAPALLYRGPDMVVRTVRDHFTNDTEEILVDTVESFDKIKEFFHLVMPKMESHVKLYQGVKPIFSHFGVEAQIESIYERKVPLPGGGSLVIDASEALVAIDVNSGKTTSSSDLEETATRTNLEAADEVGRQLRLRDLGGLIVIDFIDMFSKKNKAKVEKQLRLACKKDKARVNLSRISRFGLMEMSRQRMSPSVKVGAFDRCGVCRGTGNVRSRNTAAVGVLRRIQENLAPGNVETLDVTVSPEIAAYLLNNKTRFLMELEDKHHVKIVFQAQPGLAFDEFTYNVASRKRSAERSAESRAEPSEGRSDEKRKRSGERSAESRAEPESRLSGEQPAETRAESDPQLTEEQIEEKLKRELRQEKTLFFAPESESRDSLFSEVIHGSVLGASIPEGMLQRSGASTLGTSEQKKYDDKRGDKRGRSGREPRGRQPQGDKPRGGSRGGRDSKRGSSSGRPHQEGEQGKKWPDRPPRTANPPAVETNKTTDWINEDIGGGKPVLREPPSSPAPDSGAPESKLFKNESGGDNFKGLNEDVKPSFTRPDEPPAVIG